MYCKGQYLVENIKYLIRKPIQASQIGLFQKTCRRCKEYRSCQKFIRIGLKSNSIYLLLRYDFNVLPVLWNFFIMQNFNNILNLLIPDYLVHTGFELAYRRHSQLI